MKKYTITIEAANPPAICIGQKLLNNCTVIALRQEEKQMVSASTLAQRYGLSSETIRKRCAAINRGSSSKHLYDPEEAQVLLATSSNRRGRKRAV